MTRKPAITFGTDGVRGVMAEDFTFDTVRALSCAVAKYLEKSGFSGSSVPVGYDTRLLSREFAHEAAKILLAHGIDAIVSSSPVPSPVLSATVKLLKAPLGIMITASHNPAIYNGFKLKGPRGGPLDKKTHEAISRILSSHTYVMPLSKTGTGKIREKDLFALYAPFVARFIDTEKIIKSGITFVADSMHGAALDYLARFLGTTKVFPVREFPNPSFDGRKPEPVEENIEKLKHEVKKRGASFGIANDGDADRIAAVDEKGQYVSSHYLYLLFARHVITGQNKLLPERKARLIKTVSLTSKIDMLEKSPEIFNLPAPVSVITTKVGFSHVSEAMLRCFEEEHELVTMGGEESGGFAFSGEFPERDGLLAALMLAEIISSCEKSLSELVLEINNLLGPVDASRLDIETSRGPLIVSSLINSPPGEFAGKKVTGVSTMDNIKLFMEDNSWILFRASNTEPVLRIYAEGGKNSSSSELLEFARKHYLDSQG